MPPVPASDATPVPELTPSLRPAVAFVVLALLCSWVPWGVLLATTADPGAGPGSLALWVVGGWGPPVAAVLCAWRAQRRAGLVRLLDGLRRWRVGRWWLVLLLPPAIGVAAVLLSVAGGRAALEPDGWSVLLLLPVWLVGGVLLGGFEEVGWRGYLLPHLQQRTSALMASVVIGLVWAVWHAPLFLLAGTSQATTSALWFGVQAVGLSVLMAWVFNSTRGSLLVVVVFHGAVNGGYQAALTGLAPGAVDSFAAPAAVLGVVLAALVVWRHGAGDLSSEPRQRWSAPRA